MTNPTYFARIGNEDQRKIAEMLANDDKERSTFDPIGSPSMVNSVPVIVHTSEQDTTELVEGEVYAQVFDIGFFKDGEIMGDATWTTHANLVEIPFDDFIRRFVPLSVIGSLAKCHGATLLPNVKDLSHTIGWSDDDNE